MSGAVRCRHGCCGVRRVSLPPRRLHTRNALHQEESCRDALRSREIQEAAEHSQSAPNIAVTLGRPLGGNGYEVSHDGAALGAGHATFVRACPVATVVGVLTAGGPVPSRPEDEQVNDVLAVVAAVVVAGEVAVRVDFVGVGFFAAYGAGLACRGFRSLSFRSCCCRGGSGPALVARRWCRLGGAPDAVGADVAEAFGTVPGRRAKVDPGRVLSGR